MSIEETFLQTIDKYQLIDYRDKIILGVSGGPDSVCMFHLLCWLRERLKLRLICAHFNHMLREEADRDEEFVANLCQENKVKFISERKKVGEFFKGDSLEQTARNLRLDFFLKCAREFKVKKIALAHNKDDLVETLLMRIIRGAALRGLRSILPNSKIKGVTFIRPLLEIRKKDILQWLKNKNKVYRIDKTNFEERFFRNKIRHKLIPFLEQFNPNIVENLSTLAKTVGLDYAFIYNYSKSKFDRLKKQRGKGILKLKIKEIEKLPLAIINNVIRIAIEELKGNLRRVEAKHLEEVGDLIKSKKNTSLSLPGISINKEEDNLVILLQGD